MTKVLFEVGEARVAYEILFRGEGTEVGALALVANDVSVVRGRELNKACEVVLAVELEQGLECWQSVKLKGGGLGELDLGRLSLEDNLVLLVAGAKGERSREFRSRYSQVPWVAEVGLGLGKGCAR